MIKFRIKILKFVLRYLDQDSEAYIHLYKLCCDLILKKYWNEIWQVLLSISEEDTKKGCVLRNKNHVNVYISIKSNYISVNQFVVNIERSRELVKNTLNKFNSI